MAETQDAPLVERKPETVQLPSALKWTSYEYEHEEKSSDWFWILGIIALAGAAAAAILGDILFSIVILIGAAVVALFALREPDVVTFELNGKGLRIDQKLYPFHTLDSFWVDHYEDEKEPVLLVKAKRLLEPLIIIPIDPNDVSPEEVRAFLMRFLMEEEHEEPLSHHFMRAVGF
jgi:hypothetical protein